LHQKNQKRSGHGTKGFSLVEMLLVVTIVLILAGWALISINGTLPYNQATAGVNAATDVFHQGRDLALSQRRNYQLLYTVPNQLQLERLGIGTEAALTTLPVVTLPIPAQFIVFSGIPSPDTTITSVPCGNGLCFGGTLTQTWLSDGTFVDAAGNPLNATIFIGVPGNPSTQRAFTVLGTTGRIRAYKWTGGSWVLQ
jgi:prepilin-type N-terminal cleavage/methylation domain-containing protein